MYKILWIGLSDKENTKPLDENTNTGKIVKMIEDRLLNYEFYKINLVNFAPLDKNNKLRYPNKNEMEIGYLNLQKYIQQINPDLCILLGEKVSKFLKNKIHNYISIKHPSYIHVYHRKFINEYINEVYDKINNIFEE